jgi:hypothetical protein
MIRDPDLVRQLLLFAQVLTLAQAIAAEKRSRGISGGVHLLPSSYANVVANMNEDLRQGELIYPLLQVKGGESA